MRGFEMRRFVLVVVVLTLAACSGGISQEQYDALQAERDQLAGQVQDLEAQLFAATSTTTTTTSPTHVITGVLSLTGSSGIGHQDNRCWGEDGYDDIKAGAQVIVRDGTGRTLAVGELQAGTRRSQVECRFDFSVSGVAEAEFYTVEVSHRGEVQFSAAELEASGWVAELSLG